MITGEIKDTSAKGIRRNLANIAISAGAGAAGAGLGTKINQLAVTLVAKTGLAVGGGLVIGGTSSAATSAVNNGGDVKGSDVATGAVLGAGGSGAGQLAGSGLQAGGRMIAAFRESKLQAADRSLMDTLRRDTASAGGSLESGAVTAGNAAGNFVSNLWGNSGGLAAEVGKQACSATKDNEPGC